MEGAAEYKTVGGRKANAVVDDEGDCLRETGKGDLTLVEAVH